MNQLHSTHPHFVRCILPNHKKKPKPFLAPRVLDQLRFDGIFEDIRIARTGFPNQVPSPKSRQRYEFLCQNMPEGYLHGKSTMQIMLKKLDLDKALYCVGQTEVLLRAGLLFELEEQRDRFQSIVRKEETFKRFQERKAESNNLVGITTVVLPLLTMHMLYDVRCGTIV